MMNIKSEIDRIKKSVNDSFTAVAQMGGVVGAEKISNLPAAIRGIPSRSALVHWKIMNDTNGSLLCAHFLDDNGSFKAMTTGIGWSSINKSYAFDGLGSIVLFTVSTPIRVTIVSGSCELANYRANHDESLLINNLVVAKNSSSVEVRVSKS